MRPFFLRQAVGLLQEKERDRLAEFLGSNPLAGDLVSEAGGVRKVRWAIEGRGKRGGVRVIYYFGGEQIPLFLLTVYAKNRKANLTKAERNELKALVPLLEAVYGKAAYGKGRTL